MRVAGMIALVGSVALVPAIASAGGRHHDDGGDVRDHRTSSSSSDSNDAPVVRDHRTHDSDSHDAPIVRDHRTHDDGPVVRDHRTHGGSSGDAPDVRDHRTHDSGGDVYYSSGSDVYVEDSSPGSNPFANLTAPTWSLELGGFAHRFRGPALKHSGQLETYDGDMASYAIGSGDASKGDTAGGTFNMRFTMPVSEHLYAGAELGIGGLTRTPVQLMTNSPELHMTTKALIDTDAVIGARTRSGRLELDGEVAAGVRVVSATVEADGYGASEEEFDQQATANGVSGLVEARLRGLLWVSPHVFLAAQAGVGVLERDDVSFGLSIGLTSRPFAKTR
ncbi:MAG TPA: hypothetical protein VMZ53_31365 [Kofleriaceae bacterium]|nr:hypothetical protein [Kofleriaceae bacterium]